MTTNWDSIKSTAIMSCPTSYDSTQGAQTAPASVLCSTTLTSTDPFLIVPLSILIANGLSAYRFWQGGRDAVPSGAYFYVLTFPITSPYLPVGDICVPRGINGSIISPTKGNLYIDLDTTKVPVLLVKNDGVASKVIPDNQFTFASRNRYCNNYDPGEWYWGTQTINHGKQGDDARVFTTASDGTKYYLIGDAYNASYHEQCWWNNQDNPPYNGGTPDCVGTAGQGQYNQINGLRNYAAVSSQNLSFKSRSQISIDFNNRTPSPYLAFISDPSCYYWNFFCYTSPYGTWVNLNNEDTGGYAWSGFNQPYAFFDIIPSEMHLSCCMGNISTQATTAFCGKYLPDTADCWDPVSKTGLLHDYAKTPTNFQNSAFRKWVLGHAQGKFDTEVQAYYTNLPSDDTEFTACYIPQKFDSAMPASIQNIIQSNPRCNKTCGGVSTAYIASEWPACDINLQNCITTSNITNAGTIGGQLTISQNPNCSQYTSLPSFPAPAPVSLPSFPAPLPVSFPPSSIGSHPTSIGSSGSIGSPGSSGLPSGNILPTQDVIIGTTDLTTMFSNNQNLFIIFSILIISLLYVLFGRRQQGYPPMSYPPMSYPPMSYPPMSYPPMSYPKY